jgi:hypothetical protein
MIDKLIEAIEPFALTLIIFTGATMAGWVKFSNERYVGYAVVFFGILLFIKHVMSRIKAK